MTSRLRRLTRPLRQSRSALVATALLLVLTGVMCFLPGLGVLNYYSSLVLAVAGGLLGGVVGVSAARGAISRGQPAAREAFYAGLWLVVPPPLLLLLNALRVTNCDPLEGLAFDLLGAGLSTLLAAQVGAVAGVLGRRRRFALPIFAALWLSAIGWDLWHLYHHPAIFAYDPYVGFFSGALYDTVIELDARIVLYRLNNLVQLGALWAFAGLVAPRGARASVAALAAAPRSRWIAFGLALAAALTFFGLRGVIGYEVSRDDIEARLGGRLESDRITLIYDRAVIDAAEARALLEDHTFRLEQLDRALGASHPRRITSYVYGTIDQKRLLMGAARVYIAKPWLNEIHINRVDYGDSVVHHELSHVVLGRFAPPPLNIPTAMCVLPHMALVEGAAEAFEWDTGELNPHQWSAAMRKAGLAPALSSILGPDGFYLQPSNTAYTLSGSFIRWLLETRGPKAFERLYRDADFAAAYGEPVETLVAAWERWIDAQELPVDAQALAAERFSGKAIFYRTCPLEVARLEQEAAGLAGAGRFEEAREVYRGVAAFVPDDPAKQLPLLRLAVEHGDLAEARAAHAAYAAISGRNAATDAYAAELLGDAHWRAGDALAAARGYEAAAASPQGMDRWRNVLIKRAVAADPEREPVLGPYLLSGGGDDDEAIAYLIEAAGDFADDPLTLYLLARRYALAHRHVEAARLLRTTLSRMPATDPGGPPWLPFVRRECWRLLGHALFASDQLDEARSAFEESARLAVHAGARDRALDWAERARWKAARHGAALTPATP